jgi:hypothetical protein
MENRMRDAGQDVGHYAAGFKVHCQVELIEV